MSFERRAPDLGRQDGHDDQRRRLAALRGLAEQASQRSDPGALAETRPQGARSATQARRDPQAHRSTVLAPRTAGRRNVVSALIIVMFVVALVVGAGAWAIKSGRVGGVAPASPPPMPAVRSIDLSAYNFSCPLDPIWSPDGTQIAVSATLGDCQNEQTGGQTLAIFDAHTGKLTHNYALNTLLAKQGIVTGRAPVPFAWTPDGSSLIFTVGHDPYQISPPGTPRGLVTITLASSAVRFVADTTSRFQTTGLTTLIWDTRTGKLAHTSAELAPATDYTWGADGSLTPAAADVTGQNAVSVWQTGIISAINATSWQDLNTPPPPNQTLPQSFVYTSSLPRWSPDGRYLALPLVMGVKLPGGANAYPVVDCALICQSASVTAPDKGFSAAFAAFQKGWSPSPQQPPLWSPQVVAWRADRQELATMVPGQDSDAGKPTATVTIFNTSTGAIVKTLVIKRTNVNLTYDGVPSFAWSPRGSSLAALNYADAMLILWRAE